MCGDNKKLKDLENKLRALIEEDYQEKCCLMSSLDKIHMANIYINHAIKVLEE